jgi:putative transposase
LIWAAVVHPAHIQDAAGAALVLPKLVDVCPRLQTIFADTIYRGTPSVLAYGFGWKLEIVERPTGQKGFSALPKRWIVERTFAWLGKHRRLSKEYDELPESSLAWMYLAMIRLMTRRLRPN